MKKIMGAGIMAGVLGVGFVYLGSGQHVAIAPQSSHLAVSEAIKERGRQVAIEGDCVACHTGPEGAEFAGGLHFPSPFGDIYSTNITPDNTHGIGNYSREDFYRAVKFGYSKNAGNLYPAMPYTSYRKLNDEDMDALWAYFQSIKPIALANRDNDLIFPTNIRFSLGGWNQLFFDDNDFKRVENKSETWNQGKYFVEAAGHCGECHTPRNIGFAMKSDAALQGAIIEGWDAVDITAKQLTKRGWTHHELTRFLKEGESNLGSAFAGMYTAINHSLQHMKLEDLSAVSTYLLNEEQSAPMVMTANLTRGTAQSQRFLTEDEKAQKGYQGYVSYCAGCHGLDGLGKPNAVVAINNNSVFTSDSPYNAIAVILRGLPSKRQSITQGTVAMSEFSSEISDLELAELVNFSRLVWGGHVDSAIEVKAVKAIRKQLDEAGYLSESKMDSVLLPRN